eukprot:1189842-Prorocentrum_minimum.AAC.2
MPATVETTLGTTRGVTYVSLLRVEVALRVLKGECCQPSLPPAPPRRVTENAAEAKAPPPPPPPSAACPESPPPRTRPSA